MAVMRCLICNADMILVHVKPDDTMPVRGFEWRTFMCSACYDVERQLAFVKPAGHKSKAEPAPVHAASSSGGQPTEKEQPATLADTAASVVGEQSDDEQPMQPAPLMDAPSSVSGEQSHNEELMPPADAGPSTAPPSAVLEERPTARGLFGRVVAKMRGQ
jgi:hypothetical protein